jgi:hypothetical protein
MLLLLSVPRVMSAVEKGWSCILLGLSVIVGRTDPDRAHVDLNRILQCCVQPI